MMLFKGLNYPDMWEKAEEHYEKGLSGVDVNDVVYAANKGKVKLEILGHAPEGLEELWEELHIMVKLCQDYNEKKYQDISWHSMQKIAGAISYFVTPFDLVPDGLPKIGYLDDAAVIRHALKGTREDFDRYRQWQIDRGKKMAEEVGLIPLPPTSPRRF
jgi:uncharacterized membrane protein YkvA (DUF1232 family)